MVRYFQTVATLAVVIIVTFSQSDAGIQDFKTTFIKRKTVANSYLTLEGYSKVQCAEKCYKERKQGRCRIAAYDKASKSCRLSMDRGQDVVATQDDSVGVFIYEQGYLKDNMILFLICTCHTHCVGLYNKDVRGTQEGMHRFTKSQTPPNAVDLLSSCEGL